MGFSWVRIFQAGHVGRRVDLPLIVGQGLEAVLAHHQQVEVGLLRDILHQLLTHFTIHELLDSIPIIEQHGQGHEVQLGGEIGHDHGAPLGTLDLPALACLIILPDRSHLKVRIVVNLDPSLGLLLHQLFEDLQHIVCVVVDPGAGHLHGVYGVGGARRPGTGGGRGRTCAGGRSPLVVPPQADSREVSMRAARVSEPIFFRLDIVPSSFVFWWSGPLSQTELLGEGCAP